MDPAIQTEIERQQAKMLDKISAIMDTKMDSMKRQLEESSNSQMTELKRIRFSEPRTFRKKGHEQQYKHNEQVKTTINEARAAVSSEKRDECIAKLDEGIELIDQRQKLILIADRSEYGWKTVGEYIDNELAENDDDAKKMKKAEKEAQRKIAETRASKMAKNRSAWFNKSSRSFPSPATQSQTQYALPAALTSSQYSSPFNPSRRAVLGGPLKKPGTCFSCGKPGHWRNECPLMAVTQSQEGKKLSNFFIDVNDREPLANNDFAYELGVYLEVESYEVGEVFSKGGDFAETEFSKGSVRGRLRSHISAWQAIGPTEPILSIIAEGYKLPLLSIPDSVVLKNNRSALNNCTFVTQALDDLLGSQCISIVSSQPWVVNPLSVSIRDEGKKRLVLDLRHVNPHLFKYKFKCEDVHTAKNLLGEGYYLYTFDIKSAYHHVEIFPIHRTYLGFQWHYKGKMTYFVFNVLPFGLSTAPYVFTKLLKPVVSHWRSSGKKVCMFLDDGLGGNFPLESASVDAKEVEEDLCKLGFVLSDSKCSWEPEQIQTWLGHIFNMAENRLYVTESRIAKLRASLSVILANPYSVTARQLAHVTGCIISMSQGIGSSVYLHTRHMHFAIEITCCKSWDSIVPCSTKLIEELSFWDTHVMHLNGQKLFDQAEAFHSVVYSDASEQGYGGYIISGKQNLVCQGQWEVEESTKSSTWRELKAVHNMLLSVGSALKGHKVQWHTDNQNVVRLMARGSMKPDLHTVVEDIVYMCTKHHVVIFPVWVPREENQLADYLSKLTDVDDWGIHPCIFQWINNMWGPFTVDRFASWYNAKCVRFNSRFWNPGCEAVDAFAQDWVGENNWVVPPPSQIVRTWRHFQTCKAKGVLIVPLWKGAAFWPGLCPDGVHLAKCVTDWVGIPEFNSAATVKGRTYNSIFHGNKLKFKLIAVYVDWQSPRKENSNRGFCLSERGLCQCCLNC